MTDYEEVCRAVREGAALLIRSMDLPQDTTPDDAIINVLHIAWCNAVYEKFNNVIKAHQELGPEVEVAIKLIRALDIAEMLKPLTKAST